MTYPEILLRLRAQSFALAHWPARVFKHEAPVPLPAFAPARLYVHWLTFSDGQSPRAIAVAVEHPAEREPTFEVAELHSHGEVRRSLWRYRRETGWRYERRLEGSCGLGQAGGPFGHEFQSGRTLRVSAEGSEDVGIAGSLFPAGC